MDIRGFFGGSKIVSPSIAPTKKKRRTAIPDSDSETLDNEQTSINDPNLKMIGDEKLNMTMQAARNVPVSMTNASKKVNAMKIVSTSPQKQQEELQLAKIPLQEVIPADSSNLINKEASVKVDNFMSNAIGEATLPYKILSDCFAKIEATTKRLEIQRLLSSLFLDVLNNTETNQNEKIETLTTLMYLCNNKVAPDFEGVEIGVGEGLLLKALMRVTGSSKTEVTLKLNELGDLGLVCEFLKKSQKSLFGLKPVPLTISKVRETIMKISQIGIQEEKMALINKLLVAASPEEAKYIIRCLQGKMRIGLAEKTTFISLAKAFSQESKSLDTNSANREPEETAVERVKQVFCALPVYDDVVRALVELDGTKGLESKCHVRAGVPLKPMLAKPTNGISVIFDRFAALNFTCEYKYDGERAQLHLNDNGVVSIYSRNSENQTGKYPDVIENIPSFIKSAEDFKVTSFILDAEAVAWDPRERKILPFQKLTTRKRKDVTVDSISVQVKIFAFDLLYLNGQTLLERPLSERRQLLKQHFQAVEHKFDFATSLDTNLNKHNDNEAELTEFLSKAVDSCCEGLMVKTLDDPYQPAQRSLNWLKLKKDYMNNLADSLDLVVIGAYFGKGKRTGTYGAFLLASYNDQMDTFESITKIGTGFSDQFLADAYNSLKGKVILDKPSNYDATLYPDVWFAPSQVWEVRAADLSISPIYRSAIGKVSENKGIALRFPRFLRIRDDKAPENATTSEQVADLYNQQKNISPADTDNESIS